MSNFLDFYMNEKNKGISQDTGDIEKPIVDKKTKIQLKPVETEPLQQTEDIPLTIIDDTIQQDDFLKEELSFVDSANVNTSIPEPSSELIQEVPKTNPVLKPEDVFKSMQAEPVQPVKPQPITQSPKQPAQQTRSVQDFQEKIIIKEQPIVHIPELENKQPTSTKIEVSEIQEEPVQHVQQVQNRPINAQVTQKQIQKPISKSTKQYDNFSEEEIYVLFQKTGTQEAYYEQWKRVYLDSFKTKKNNYIVQKCKQGLFRLNESGKIEILPNFPTYGKTPEQIIKELTMPNRENLIFMGKN